MDDANEKPQGLPEPGKSHERNSLDFKLRLDLTDQQKAQREIAKDVAAFANASGGTVIIGAAANGEFLAKYEPLADDEASRTQRAIEQAVRDRCQPTPLFVVDMHPCEGGIVLAVVIEPMVGAAVGVRLKQNEFPGLLEGTFLYPVRNGSHTTSISPDQMHMYVDAAFRRKVLMLNRHGGVPIILEGRLRKITSKWMASASVIDLKPEENVLRLNVRFNANAEYLFHLPIDLIETVWRGQDALHVAIPGYLDLTFEDDGEREAVFFRIEAPRQS